MVFLRAQPYPWNTNSENAKGRQVKRSGHKKFLYLEAVGLPVIFLRAQPCPSNTDSANAKGPTIRLLRGEGWVM